MKGKRILYGLVGTLLILALSAVVGRGARTQAAAVDETLLLAVENAAGQDPAVAASRVFAAESSRNKAIRDSNALISVYPQIRFFFLSAGPGEGETYFSTDIPKMNAEADAFNAGMRARCLADYVPVAEYLKSDGFKTMDGMHYDAATCKKIYAYVLRMTEP